MISIAMKHIKKMWEGVYLVELTSNSLKNSLQFAIFCKKIKSRMIFILFYMNAQVLINKII